MARRKQSAENSPDSSIKFIHPDAQENRMINLAMDLAEKQLAEGTASPSVITHFLKMGTEKYKLEQMILESQRDLTVAKTEALETGKHIEELYAEAITAMREYRGENTEDIPGDVVV